ncbi:MAG: hypothetical protein PHF21_01270 [Bacilli bacterium]|nr:hypothetical protein [Bacilli bacterium]
MAKKFKVILLLISMSTCLGLMSSTYSRYVASTNSDINVSLSKWQILLNNYDITNSQNSNIALEPVIEENEHVAQSKIAPATKGYFDIEIDPTNVDVSFNYSIDLQIQDNNLIPDLMITKYAIIPDDYIETEELSIIYLENDSITNSMLYNNNIDEFQFKTFTIRVYFEWYEGVEELMNDEDDTLIGTLAVTENASFKMNASIKFEQIID